MSGGQVYKGLARRMGCERSVSGCHLLGHLSPLNVAFITTKKMTTESTQSGECICNPETIRQARPLIRKQIAFIQN